MSRPSDDVTMMCWTQGKAAAMAALLLLCVHCQREQTPQGSSPQPPDAALPLNVTGSSSPPAEARSANPEPRAPAPRLPSGKHLAWQIEQDGRPVVAKGHTVELVRAPFTFVFHLRAGVHDLFANASFKSKTFDAARLGWQFIALTGIRGASRFDEPSEANNRLRDIYVDDHAPNQWLVCPPDSTCRGFDEPCEPTAEGAVCRRSIERVEVYSRGKQSDMKEPRREIASIMEEKLYLVFIVPGHWSEDERAEKLPYQSPELARDWVMIVWKSTR